MLQMEGTKSMTQTHNMAKSPEAKTPIYVESEWAELKECIYGWTGPIHLALYLPIIYPTHSSTDTTPG